MCKGGEGKRDAHLVSDCAIPQSRFLYIFMTWCMENGVFFIHVWRGFLCGVLIFGVVDKTAVASLAQDLSLDRRSSAACLGCS